MTGLATGLVSGYRIFETVDQPGGICSSYYIRPGETQRLPNVSQDGEMYRFEIGGGHWIFGGDPAVLRFMRALVPMKSYARRSSVYFGHQSCYVPYPLQNHLGHLGKEVAVKALAEIASASKATPATMADWLEQSFGETLTGLFFAPFHELYTAGLWRRIAPQDAYKSPVDFSLALRGAFDTTPPVGYNTTFLYPVGGLNTLAQRMVERCQVHYGKRVMRVDVRHKEIHFVDGSGVRYDDMISTLPLNRMMEVTDLEIDAEPDPYTSVLVLNIGATKGPGCPDDHWLYIPQSRSGFHRVGFYSNVDTSFLPKSSQELNDRVSIYIERAYVGGQKPSEQEIQAYVDAVVQELREWGFIQEVEVVDPTWIDVAYTWSWPGSNWRTKALKRLDEHGIVMVGRYGRWVFQGIAESIAHGLMVGATFKRQ
jgi:protoporphyrinogen oxidase